MANTNFLQFDSNQTNMLSDAAYGSDTQRQSGVSSGIARSSLHNKVLFQSSTMACALANLMVDNGLNASDNNLTALKTNLGSLLDNKINSKISTLLSGVWPVGSIYIGTQSTCPLATLISGSTWVKVEGRYLLASGTLTGTSETYSATNTVPSGLPNVSGITGSYGNHNESFTGSGAFYEFEKTWGIGDTDPNSPRIAFEASRSNSTYGQSDAVRAPAYVVNVWRRTV